MDELIAKRYIKALIETIKDPQEALEVLQVLSRALDDNATAEFFASPIIPDEKKTEVILSVLQDAQPHIVHFIKLLGEHKRLNLIPLIARELEASLQRASKRFEGVVQSAQELDESLIASLQRSIQRYTGFEVTLHQERSKIDGIHLHIEDLGIEVHFSKEKVKRALIEHIKRSI